MVAESPGGALFAPPNTDVIDPPGTAVIEPTAVPADTEEYVLSNITRVPRTPTPGATKPSYNDVAPAPVNLYTN